MQIKTLLLDIDGVVNNKGFPVPGVENRLQRIIKKGINIKFVTNCSLHKLHRFDEKIVPGYKLEIIDPIDVLISLAKKDRFLFQYNSTVIGTKEIRNRISEFGIISSKTKDTDVVFIFEKLNYNQEEILYASRSVLNGAKLYCAGSDRLFWYQGNVYPGVGAITEQIKFMTQTEAFILGKPSKLIFELALGSVPEIGSAMFVGDDFNIDILGAKNCGLMTVYLTNNPVRKVTDQPPQADQVEIDFITFADKFL